MRGLVLGWFLIEPRPGEQSRQMQTMWQAAAPGTRDGRLLKWLERLLLIIGGATLVWCAWVVTNAYVVQRLARETLASRRVSTSSRADQAPRPSSRPRSIVAVGSPLAELSIPRVGLSAVVLQGSDEHILRQGLGHIEATPLPGETGNVAITGHRDSFFRPLRKVRVGDDIWIDVAEAHLHYRVAWLRIVKPTETSVVGPSGSAMLTLVTCYPFSVIGPAPDRFIVRAIRAEDPSREGQAGGGRWN